MPYIETEKVAQMRKEIRAALPDFKVSVTRHHGSTVDVRLMSGPIANIEHVNVFYYKKNLEDRPDAVKVIDTILEIVKRIGQPRELVYDSGYGSVLTFYYDVSFGKWNQPYECTDPDAEDRVEIWKEFNQIRRFEEQAAGFRSKFGADHPATGGFTGRGMRGRVEYVTETTTERANEQRKESAQ